MPDIHIHREHHLGFKEARKVAFSWAETVSYTHLTLPTIYSV